MAATRLTDVIVPKVWNPYMIERTAENSAYFRSGIVQGVSPEELGWGGEGNTVEMPFWQDLTGADEVVAADGTALAVNAIGSAQDTAVVLTRGKAWGANELAAALAGDDPMDAITDLVAEYWARRFNALVIAECQGVFASLAAESPAVNTLDISTLSGTAAVIDGEAMLDLVQLLGDSKDKLTAFAMHSAVENKLAKLDLIDFIEDSQNGTRIPTYMGKPVVVDDDLPVASGVYDIFAFGRGAFAYAENNRLITPSEVGREHLKGEDELVTRRRFIMHPRGVKYDGAATGGGPANTVLDDAASWTRVYEAKNVRLARLKAKIAA